VPVVALVIAGVLALGLLLASVYVVWLAPSLLAELLLDGALSYTLYRHLRRDALGQPRHWVQTALRRTVWPFVGVAVFLTAVGAALQLYAPEAHTLGEVWHRAPAAATLASPQ
jgi:hypothetical protein